MPLFKIHHITNYNYDRPVKENINQVKIYPVENEKQQVKDFELTVSGDPVVHQFEDFFGNKVGDFNVHQPHTELSIDCRMTVATDDKILLHEQLPQTDLKTLYAETEKQIFLFRLSDPERINSKAKIDAILAELQYKQLPVSEIARACCNYVFSEFQYQKGITNIETTVDEILEHRQGVCQDFAHVLLQLLRTAGIPARYVSGYICPNKSGLRGEGATHAWIEYYLPGYGWVGLDPTNNILVNNHHIKLATGRDFGDCTPVKGMFKGIARQTLSVYVSVGYEDGHVFEDKNNVKMELQIGEGTEEWQSEYIKMMQQQQQQ
ncbi:MAG: transglutaminase family protein [Bacteroidota bacterium]